MLIKMEITDQVSVQSLKYESPFSFANIVDDMKKLYMPECGFYIIRYKLNNLHGQWTLFPEMIVDDYGPECLRNNLISFVFEYIESFIEKK